MSPDSPEISDLIVHHDPETLARVPVARAAVVARFRALGNEKAARYVERLPVRDGGLLDEAAVDELLVRVHTEMQQLSEEFQHGQRVAELLRPVLDAIRARGEGRLLRVVDVGCGSGYVVRWLAARGNLGSDVELVGADLNSALVARARALAAQEGLNASFVAANAFRLETPATVLVTTGVLHHFRGADLDAFLAGSEREGTRAFVHFDFQPSPVAPLGSWIFHQLRFREPLAFHDGVLSAVRAHTGATLVGAARRAAPGFATGPYATHVGPFPRAFHTLLGIRRELVPGLEKALGRRRSWLGELA